MNIERFHIDGDKSNSKNGYRITTDNGAVIEGSWKDGTKELVKKGSHISKFDMAQKMRKALVMDDIYEKRLNNLKDLIDRCPLASDHPYLKTKKIDVKNNSYVWLGSDGTLIIPIYKNIHYHLMSAQFIYPDGSKKFAKGLPVKSGYARTNGANTEEPALYICEGYATGLTISMLTGCDCFCAMSASNIPAVCRAIDRILCGTYGEKWPENKIIVADNDGAGIQAAMEAHEETGFKVVMPDKPGYDFNDLYQEDPKHAKELLTFY